MYWLKEENNGDGLSALTGNDDNEMDSWANRSNSSSAGYDQFGSGDCQTFGPVSNDDNVNPFNSDEISSWRANGGC